MAYATWAEVQGFLPPDSRNSEALENTAEGLLEPVARRIDSKLGERYTVPLVLATSPVAYAWAKDLNAKFVAGHAMVAARALMGEEGEATWYPDRLLKEAEADLAAAASGAVYLTDAVLSTTEGGEFRATDGYSSLSTTNQGYIAPWFKRSDSW
jgi:hypothetical protein